MGLAGATAEALKQRGFVIGTTATVDAYDGVARISFGKNGVAQAYTLLAQFDGATMLALGGDDATVNVALGAKFDELKPVDAVGLDPAVPLVAPAGCTPVRGVRLDGADPGTDARGLTSGSSLPHRRAG